MFPAVGKRQLPIPGGHKTLLFGISRFRLLRHQFVCDEGLG